MINTLEHCRLLARICSQGIQKEGALLPGYQNLLKLIEKLKILQNTFPGKIPFVKKRVGVLISRNFALFVSQKAKVSTNFSGHPKAAILA